MVVEYVMGANAAAGLSAIKILLKATQEWKSMKPRWLQVQQFKRLIDRNSVLGFQKNLRREKYATTPIIKAMGNEADFGAVSVALVPPCRGKTTAAYYFLQKNKKQIRGISICRPDRSTPYVMAMLDLLGLNPLNPPSGWLSCLVDALDEDDGKDGRRSVLILDEYVSSEENDADATLIQTLKLLLTSSSVRVIVLTPSEKYAHYLLTLNALQGIVPLAGTYSLDQEQKAQWRNMQWPIPTLKVAAKHNPLFKGHDTRVDSEIDDFTKGLTEEQVESLTIRDILTELRGRLFEPQPELAQNGVGTDSSSAISEEGTHEFISCSQCSIS